MGERKHTAFFYGTLMAPQVLYRVIHGSPNPPRSLQGLTPFRSAILTGYQRHRVKYCDYPAISPCEGATVRGSFVTGLSDSHIARLDIFEGSQYERKRVQVKLLSGVGLEEAVENNGDATVEEEVEAETYVFHEQYLDSLEEDEWDFEVFKREKMKYWMGLHDDEEEGNEYIESNGIEVDEGFADVDRAVAAGKVDTDVVEQNGSAEAVDPTGGRGLNGSITRQLQELGRGGKKAE